MSWHLILYRSLELNLVFSSSWTSCIVGLGKKLVLVQHTKRVAYQAEHYWGQCLVSNPELPSPSLHGDGQNPSQMHGSLGGPPYLKHPVYLYIFLEFCQTELLPSHMKNKQ